jgi:hypothetical protein
MVVHSSRVGIPAHRTTIPQPNQGIFRSFTAHFPRLRISGKLFCVPLHISRKL